MDLLDPLLAFFTDNGYLAVFVVLLACGFGMPIPEDITLVAGGIIAGIGDANVHLMCLVGLAGVLSGDAVMFWTGRHFGERARQLRWVSWLLTPKRYARIEALYRRHGNRLMFIARFLPGLRTPIYLTAGMTRRVPFWRFLMLDGLAALISVPLWVYLGYFGAENHEWLLLWIRRSKTALAIILALFLTLLLVYVWRRRTRRQRLCREREARRQRRQPAS
ncbi:DedA family protein [Solimonas variicoloris]|uniref:DedA family protein n=1 Tax=Solimonas variicoloris TaxID=254408 RepID=UPI00037687F8|nr:DedA family protein [Solimonas variicoloris]